VEAKEGWTGFYSDAVEGWWGPAGGGRRGEVPGLLLLRAVALTRFWGQVDGDVVSDVTYETSCVFSSPNYTVAFRLYLVIIVQPLLN
jgi:hypothetical protein